MGEGEFPSDPDFIVLGLGNPGARYRDTRHNFGVLVVDALARASGEVFRADAGSVLVCPFTEGRERGILAKPTTYMNRSGRAARALRDRYENTPLSRFLVVVDDLDLPLGRIRFRKGGGYGGHRGLRSLIDTLQTREFPRLRLGISRPEADEREDVVDYVLEPFPPAERETVREVVGRAAEGVRVFVSDGIQEAMNRYNAG